MKFIAAQKTVLWNQNLVHFGTDFFVSIAVKVERISLNSFLNVIIWIEVVLKRILRCDNHFRGRRSWENSERRRFREDWTESNREYGNKKYSRASELSFEEITFTAEEIKRGVRCKDLSSRTRPKKLSHSAENYQNYKSYWVGSGMNNVTLCPPLHRMAWGGNPIEE